MRWTLLISHQLAGAAALFCGLGLVAPSRAQLPGTPTAADSLLEWTLTGNYEGTIRGNVTSVSMGNRFSSSLARPSGLNATASLGVREVEYRLRTAQTTTKDFTTSVASEVRPGLFMSVAASDNRSFDRVITSSAVGVSGVQDISIESQRANAGMNYVKPFVWGLSLNTGAEAAIFSRHETSLDESGREGTVRGDLRYKLGDRIKVMSRGYLSKSASSAETRTARHDGLGKDIDSLSAGLTLAFTDSANVQVTYRRGELTNQYMDLPRGVFLEQQFSGDRVRETQTTTGESIVLDGKTVPLSGVTLAMSAEHTESQDDFAFEKKRFRRTVVDALKGGVGYKVASGTTVDVTLERQEATNDYGPLSIASYDEKKYKAALVANHRFTRTLSATFQAGTGIVQSFYFDFETNPRDRDQLDQYMNLRLTASTFPKISSQIYLAVNRTDYVNIDATFAQDNRAETTYDLRPELTYKLNDRVSVRQSYVITIEFTDYDFNEDDNFLDRNFTLTNTIKAKLAPALDTEMAYQLRFHDQGSYLTPPGGGERLLDIDQEDRRDEMKLSFSYKLTPHISVTGANDYARRRDRILASGSETVFTEGGIQVGLTGSYDIRKDRTIKVDLKKVNRFGRYSDEKQKDYWEMNSTVNLAF